MRNRETEGRGVGGLYKCRGDRAMDVSPARRSGEGVSSGIIRERSGRQGTSPAYLALWRTRDPDVLHRVG